MMILNAWLALSVFEIASGTCILQDYGTTACEDVNSSCLHHPTFNSLFQLILHHWVISLNLLSLCGSFEFIFHSMFHLILHKPNRSLLCQISCGFGQLDEARPPTNARRIWSLPKESRAALCSGVLSCETDFVRLAAVLDCLRAPTLARSLPLLTSAVTTVAATAPATPPHAEALLLLLLLLLLSLSLHCTPHATTKTLMQLGYWVTIKGTCEPRLVTLNMEEKKCEVNQDARPASNVASSGFDQHSACSRSEAGPPRKKTERSGCQEGARAVHRSCWFQSLAESTCIMHLAFMSIIAALKEHDLQHSYPLSYLLTQCRK